MVAEKVSWTERLMIIGNTLFHQALAVVTVFILWTVFYNFDISQKFTWHVGLCTIAYVPMMAEGIILFSTDNVWTKKIDRTTRYWIHGIILILSAILVTIGISFEIQAKDSHQATHFKTLHARFGLVSWIFVLLSQCLGLASAKPQIFKSVIRPVYVKFIHNVLGTLGYVFGIVSLCHGLEKGSIRRLTSVDARLATYYVLGISVCWSLLGALKTGYNQVKTMLT